MMVQTNNEVNEIYVLQQDGKYLEAIQHAHAKLVKAKLNNDVRCLLDTYVDLYYCYFNELLFEEALHVFEEHEKLFATTNNPVDVMYHHLMSYMLYDMTKQYDAGITVLQKAISIATSLRQHHIVGLANCFIGALYTRKKEHALAIQYATLGVAYIRTLAPNLSFYHMQCEVCLTQVFVSARALSDAAPLIRSIEAMQGLQKHQTIYFQFLFAKLRYLYCQHELTEARAFRDVLLQAIDSTNDYVIAKMLLPTITQTLIDLQLNDELTFWIQYEHTLQSVMTYETATMLQAFSAQQQALLANDGKQRILPKLQFFERGQALFESTNKPLLLLLCHIEEESFTATTRSYFQFHMIQQAMEQLLVHFPNDSYIGCHLTQNKFALLFQHDDLDFITSALQHFPSSVHVDLFEKAYDSPLYFSYTNTLMSRSNSFLEMYHLTESRLYQLVFQ